MRALWIILGVIGAGLILLILNHEEGRVFGLESGRFAQVLFLGVWGTVIGAAIIPRAGGFGEMARNIAIWLVIILVLMGGYVYRYELQDIASRMSAGIIPGSPVSLEAQDGRQRIMVMRGSNGHFEVNANVNGAPLTLLVDTGAGSVVLSQDDARKAGIDTDSLAYSVQVSTANGRTTAAPVSLGTLDIGGIQRDRIRALVARPGALESSLLGMNYLETLWSFEIRGDRLVLTD